jgi:hypothetical protein
VSDKLRDSINAADSAARLLRDEAFTNAVEAVRQELVDLWMRSSSAESREKIWQSVNLLEKLVGVIANTEANGAVAKAELKAQIEEQERRKRFRVFG